MSRTTPHQEHRRPPLFPDEFVHRVRGGQYEDRDLLWKILEVQLTILQEQGELKGILMGLREDLNNAEGEIESALTELLTRVSNIPTNVDEIEQSDVDELHSFAGRLAAILPTTDTGDGSTPADPGTDPNAPTA